MNLDSFIMPGVVLGLAAVGGIGTWFTLKAKMDDLSERAKATAAQHEASQRRIGDLELRMERECVKKDDLERVEDRISKRFEAVEHTVRNTAMQIIAALSGGRS